MLLTELDATFLKWWPDNSRQKVPLLEQACGIMFQCPACAAAKGLPAVRLDGRTFYRGVHYVICWFRGKVPDGVNPRGRWTPDGTGLADLTFVPGGPAPDDVSILLPYPGCGWRGHVADGRVS